MSLYQLVLKDDSHSPHEYQLLKDGQVIVDSCNYAEGCANVSQLIRPGDEFEGKHYPSRVSYEEFRPPPGSISHIVLGIINSIPNEITQGEAFGFNALYSLGASEVVITLQKLVEEGTHPINARAMDALLKLDHFDKVGYLLNLFDAKPEWQYALCEDLSRFPEERVIQKLCDIVTKHRDSSVRFTAAEQLAKMGDGSAIQALEYAESHDTDTDWEGHPIAKMASKAIERIQTRMKEVQE